MDMSRSAGLVMIAFLVVTTGCSGPLVEHRASPATIPDTVLASTDYRHQNTTEIPLTYPLGVGGLSRAISVRTWLSAYAPEATDGPVATILVISSPDIKIAGESVNPLSQFSNRELTRFVLEQVGDARDVGGPNGKGRLREVEARSVTVLDSNAELVRYAGLAEVDGQNVSIIGAC